MKQNKWKMNRAGLLNFWYYEDETFDFADGKLLLRGSNGSGKSVTMQSILPILLDGRKSPDRLDPFGSRARKIEDYLLGEKEIVDRDERTGYLFLEYKREDTNQYITTGIGMQARRNKSLHSWYFVLTDNRRIGEDLLLYETEKDERIPLSRMQLENRIADGGQVVRTQGEYMKLVNKHIFGFETLEAYEDLIKLLIQLRSPKLSKDFRPTVIYEILEAALPPLTDEDLRHLSDTIEHMDQTKQQMEQLEREHDALKQLIQRYDAYNEFRLTEIANAYVSTMDKKKQQTALLEETTEQLQQLEADSKQLTSREQQLEQEEEVLTEQEKRLEKHEVWSLEAERKQAQERLQELKEEIAGKSQALSAKMRDEIKVKERADTTASDMGLLEEEIADVLEDLSDDAEDAAFHQHAQNVADFQRHHATSFTFTMWKKEAEAHYERLEAISESLREFDQLKEQITQMEKTIATTQMEFDRVTKEKQEWEQIFERDKQEKINEIHQWTESYPFLNVDDVTIQTASRRMETLYDRSSYSEVVALFTDWKNQYVLGVQEQLAAALNEKKQIQDEKTEAERLYAEWQAKKDPAWPYQAEATREAREVLRAQGTSFAPFYEVVEFQAQVTEEAQKRLEAAIIDAGLMDALITEENMVMQHDRKIAANPQMMAHTLADFLEPDLKEDVRISAREVDDVLQSIVIDQEASENLLSIQPDGFYSIGLIEGHAVPIEQVQFIGRNARKRYREQEMAKLQHAMEACQEQIEKVQSAMQAFENNIAQANEALELFPADQDLQVSFQEMTTASVRLEQFEKQLVEYDRQKQGFDQQFYKVKRSLTTQTSGLNITFSLAAYQDAKQIQRHYEKTLQDVERKHTTYLHYREREAELQERLTELEEEVDELKGEQNVLEDRDARTTMHIESIENQLALQGMEEVRAEIQSVQDKLAVTKENLQKVKVQLPENKVTLKEKRKALDAHEQRLEFQQAMEQAWKTLYEREVDYQFVAFPFKENEALAQHAARVAESYAYQPNQRAKIEEQLSKAFFEQQNNLIEYRMNETATEMPLLDIDDATWTEDQTILWQDWQQKASRRIIQLDFQGKWLSPYYVFASIQEDWSRQETLLNDQDRQLYEDILFDSVGKKLRSRITRAEQWAKKMNELMAQSESTSGIRFFIQWKPKTADSEDELDTKELVDLLRRDARLLKEEDLDRVMNHFRSRIERAKELVEMQREGNSLLQVLKEVLDYRHWFSFVLSYQRTDEPKRELTNNAFYKFSGGEKAMAMYIPLFTACYSRYTEAEAFAPYIVSLDEAFAGVDDDNISAMFRILEELGFDYIMNSQSLWGDYPTVSALAIYELIRPKNADFVSTIGYIWDGYSRYLQHDPVLTAGEGEEQT